jgi:holo-[acyl-carrier protein] synthase
MGLGIDIVHMPRFENKEALARRILSKEELIIYQQRTDKVRFLSGRFAAKEAFLKAVKGGFGNIAFSHISILYDHMGVPYLIHKDQKYDVSISHDGEYAIAVVMIPEQMINKISSNKTNK